MKYRKLGNTDIEVSTVALGCWGFVGGSMWGDTAEKDSINTIHAAMDAGITFLDTAEGYGDGLSEQIVGKALKGRRDKAIVATKVGLNHFDPVELRKACERSLSYLGTDYIDLYQLHWPFRESGVTHDVQVEELEKLKREGKIRQWGVCNFGPYDLDDFPHSGSCVSNQLAYSLLFRALEYEILPRAQQMGMGVLVYSGLLHGILAGGYRSADEVPEGRARTRHFSPKTRPGARHEEDGQEELTFQTLDKIRQIGVEAGRSMADVAIAWVLAQPGITSILAGARQVDQAVQNAAMGDVEVSPDVLNALSEATEPLKETLGANPDMWQSTSRVRWGKDA